MRTLTHGELRERFPDCPRPDAPQYLADCALRKLQNDPSRGPTPPWRVDAGVGSLEAYGDGTLKYLPAASEREPTPTELAGRFKDALSRWVAEGAPLASEGVLRHRRSTCLACPKFLKPSMGNGWLGKCSQCGCTGVKLYLATEACPLGYWTGETR